MSSRITHSKLGLIHTAICDHWAENGPPGKIPVPLWLADITLRFARKALKGSNRPVLDPSLSIIRHVLERAANSNLTEVPRWFAYLEAVLHMSERMLGAQISLNSHRSPAVAIHPSRSRGQLCGAYATPHFIVEAVLSDVFAALDPTAALTILDLSVEAGQFPISVLAQAPLCADIQFYAVDKDATALKLTHKLFSFAQDQNSREAITLTLACRDSLLDPLPRSWPGQFKVIMGNPPWSGHQKGYTARVRDAFRPWLSRNFDLYLAFLLRADALLEPGGILAFVMPSTLLFNDSAQTIREYLLDNYNVLSLRIYPQRSFIEIPCLIPISLVLLKKASRSNSFHRTLIAYHPNALGGSQRPRTSMRSDAQRFWKDLPGKPFHPLVSPEYAAFLRQFASYPRLADYGRVLPGSKLERRNTVAPPVEFAGLQARDIRPFHACCKSSRIYTRKDFRFAVPPQPQNLDRSKVVFQNFRYMTHARRLVAATAGPGCYGVSTASVFIPEDQTQTDFFTALLNSSVANAWFKLRDVSRSIKLALVREIPVAVEPQLIDEIQILSRRCSAIRMVLHEALDRCTLTKEDLFLKKNFPHILRDLRKSEAGLETLFAELYGLSRKHQALTFELSSLRVF